MYSVCIVERLKLMKAHEGLIMRQTLLRVHNIHPMSWGGYTLYRLTKCFQKEFETPTYQFKEVFVYSCFKSGVLNFKSS